ncbi:hypothetical protein SLEP1_g40630 [Rubroshorea leprosula]|uniref:Uncharacterized protein n=1 Tax=Rubroshorea leprosula TaxID=152421 RepID=A0AAV5L459_9ROSI|nr:hypothetical protein SLEP1_g40630 [Rubroshorea leprosula]
MSTDQALQLSAASIVEDVLQQQRKSGVDFYSMVNSRKTEEASFRRNEAARWLRRTVGVVGGKDLPAEPSEEEFRLALRSGIILCNVLNKVHPGSVQKVVESPGHSVLIPDGNGLSAFQYFENVRNFLVAMEEMGLPTFDVSDLEQGGKSSRTVNCVLALKSYSEWRQGGGNGSWKYAANAKPPSSGPGSAGKQFVRKNSSMNSIVRSLLEKSVDSLASEQSDTCEADTTTSPIYSLVRASLLDKKPEEIPMIVESLLGKVMEEFDGQLASQNELIKSIPKDAEESGPSRSLSITSFDPKVEAEAPAIKDEVEALIDVEVEGSMVKAEVESPAVKVEDATPIDKRSEEESSNKIEKEEQDNQMLVEQQQRAEESDGRLLKLKQKILIEQQQRGDETEGRLMKLKQKILIEQQQRGDETEGRLMKLKQKMLIEQQRWDKESKAHLLKQKMCVEQQCQDVQELKHTLHITKEGMQILQVKCWEEFNNIGNHLRSLAHAAAGYQRVLEENRKLYNQLQDLKGNIRVYCRVRPFLGGQSTRLVSVLDNIDEGSITIVTPSKYGKGRKAFTFNKVFGPSASQAEVFSDTQPLIRSVLDGYNVCIFAYGQTGTGKTYTMTGPKELTEEGLGVNYRALGDLFLLSEKRKDTICYEISVQMLEIYNEQVRDLLVSDGEIRNSSSNGINVPDANLVPVSSTSDVINLMNLGHKNRAVGATAMNDQSSRSHSCLTVHVQGRDLTSGTIIRGSLHLVDLAGSERVDKSEVMGDRLKEAVHINKSLSALGDVIASLAQKGSHVPYRNSKLTQLLQDSLGGQAKTLMFVHISPEPEALSETISTLKFAERVATVELGAAKVNKDTGEVKELKEQIASLKAALARKEEVDNTNYTQTGSSLHPKFRSTGDMSSSRRQSLDNAITRKNDSSSTSRRHSLDLQELSAHSSESSLWPQLSSPALSIKDDDRGSVSSDWVDKVMLNKGENLNFGSLEPEKLYQSCIPVPTKIFPEHNSDKFTANRRDSQDSDVLQTQYEFVTTDDSDFDAATSDYSETDSLWQSSIPKVTNIPSGVGPKAKKPNPKAAKSTETRSSIPSLIPSMQARKASNGVNSNLHKPGRQKVTVGGRRKIGHAK